jgi:hypothetical protein
MVFWGSSRVCNIWPRSILCACRDPLFANIWIHVHVSFLCLEPRGWFLHPPPKLDLEFVPFIFWPWPPLVACECEEEWLLEKLLHLHGHLVELGSWKISLLCGLRKALSTSSLLVYNHNDNLFWEQSRSLSYFQTQGLYESTMDQGSSWSATNHGFLPFLEISILHTYAHLTNSSDFWDCRMSLCFFHPLFSYEPLNWSFGGSFSWDSCTLDLLC